ncbi:laccase-7-like, partial [Fagus crenata]
MAKKTLASLEFVCCVYYNGVKFCDCGEWWNANVVDVENEGLASGGAPNNSDAYTINGKPGSLPMLSKS